jgi:hypothetical protein
MFFAVKRQVSVMWDLVEISMTDSNVTTLGSRKPPNTEFHGN